MIKKNKRLAISTTYLDKLFLNEMAATFLPMYVCGEEDFLSRVMTSSFKNQSLELYSYGVVGQSRALKLVVWGRGFPCQNFYLPLICYNDTIFESLTLYTSGGGGITEGAVPFHDTINLYIRMKPVSDITLYTIGEDLTSNNGFLDFCTLGGDYSFQSLEISVPNIYDINSNSLTLYTHGF